MNEYVAYARNTESGRKISQTSLGHNATFHMSRIKYKWQKNPLFSLINRAAEGGRGSRIAFGFLNRAVVGWAVSCSAFG